MDQILIPDSLWLHAWDSPATGERMEVYEVLTESSVDRYMTLVYDSNLVSFKDGMATHSQLAPVSLIPEKELFAYKMTGDRSIPEYYGYVFDKMVWWYYYYD